MGKEGKEEKEGKKESEKREDKQGGKGEHVTGDPSALSATKHAPPATAAVATTGTIDSRKFGQKKTKKKYLGPSSGARKWVQDRRNDGHSAFERGVRIDAVWAAARVSVGGCGGWGWECRFEGWCACGW